MRIPNIIVAFVLGYELAKKEREIIAKLLLPVPESKREEVRAP